VENDCVRQGPISHEELDAAVRRFKKAIIERAVGGELTHHLGYPPGGAKPDDTTNHRNGSSGKTVLRTRGCQDILIAVTDGLKEMSDALAAVFPARTLQTCIVHLIRNSLDFSNWTTEETNPTHKISDTPLRGEPPS
jgi:transposase-like protein